MNVKYFARKFLSRSWVFLFCWAHVTLAQTKVDVNDVSYLWPPALNVKEAAEMVSLPQLVPDTVFQEIIDFAQGKKQKDIQLDTPLVIQEPVIQMQNWRLVALRIDPCAPGLAFHNQDMSQCIQEIRLVAQPFLVDEGLITHFDYSLHIIFEMNQGDPRKSESFSNLWKQILKLKLQNKEAGVDTNGVALRVHPGFKVSGFRKQFQDLILQNIKISKLKKVTFIGAALAEGPWIFFQGLVNDQHYVLEPDPSMHGQSFGHVVPKAPGLGGTLSPLPTNKNWPVAQDQFFGPSINDLFFDGVLDLKKPATLANQTESKVFKIEDIVHALDNPSLSNRTNTDCFSCHTTTSRTYLLELEKNDSPFKFKTPNDHVTLTPAMINKSFTNFRAFGWFGSKGMVSQRVINESADVANLIEKLF